MQALSDDAEMSRVEARVDCLEKKVDDGFAAVRADIKDVRGEIRDVRGEIKEGRGEIKDVRGEARADFRTLLGVQLAMFATMIFGFAGLLAEILLRIG